MITKQPNWMPHTDRVTTILMSGSTPLSPVNRHFMAIKGKKHRATCRRVDLLSILIH